MMPRQMIDIRRGESLTIEVDGQRLDCFRGETVAAVLAAADRPTTRRDGGARLRGFWCAMGTCAECFVERVDLVPPRRVRACLQPVEPGMRIQTGAAGDA